jgi:hypothetical protein
MHTIMMKVYIISLLVKLHVSLELRIKYHIPLCSESVTSLVPSFRVKIHAFLGLKINSKYSFA